MRQERDNQKKTEEKEKEDNKRQQEEETFQCQKEKHGAAMTYLKIIEDGGVSIINNYSFKVEHMKDILTYHFKDPKVTRKGIKQDEVKAILIENIQQHGTNKNEANSIDELGDVLIPVINEGFNEENANKDYEAITTHL
eukprot:298201-Ditylum_brightwellii.AAC.1